MPAPSTILIMPAQMRSVFATILLQYGFTRQTASQCADVFTSNSIDGIYSHGVNRFSKFIDYIKKGYIKPDATPTLLHAFNGIEQWDGNFGPGPINAGFATERASELASKYGIGCVTLANTNHWMRGGLYGWQAAQKGFALIAWTNTIGNMPAWGASDARMGNNPLVFAMPYHNDAIVLDMAMSLYSFGAMEQARMKNEKLAMPGGYDAAGNLTNDPSLILETRRPIPIGYWKGAGLSLLLDIFAAILSGGLATHEITAKAIEFCSQVYIAIDISKLHNHKTIQQAVNNIIQDYKESAPAEEKARISYPGERVLKTREQNTTHGIPVLQQVWKEIMSL
jgi:3-dehydro-L-gulonate 2-dehydrogenase